MPSLSPILEHAAGFLLVLFRLSGLLLFAPLLSSAMIPARVRVILCVALAVCLYPTVPPAVAGPETLDVFTLGPLVIAEVLVGLAIGLLAALPMYAVQLGGWLMSQQAGMTMGIIFNPALDVESDIIGQLLLYSALVIFVSLGGLEALFLALAGTFAAVPPGAALGLGAAALAPVELFTGLVSSGFELALRVSAPILCIVMIETVVTAVVGKTMPQLNVLSVGYAIKIVLVFLALIAGAAALAQVIADDYDTTLGLVARWAASLGVSR